MATRTKINRVCCGIANASLIGAGTAGLVCHISTAVKAKHYGFIDGLIDVFAVGFICSGIEGMANAICDNKEQQQPAAITDK